MGTVAGIHDGHWGHFRGILCGALDVVAHHNHVGIVRDHQDGVLQRLALRTAGDLRIGKSDHAGTKSVGGSLKTQAGAGRRLEEKRGDDFSFQ